jgi:hypothetical protein
MDEIGRSRHRSLHPIRGELLRALSEGLAKPLADQVRLDVANTPGSAALQALGDRLTNLLQDAAEGFLDPKSGRMRKGRTVTISVRPRCGTRWTHCAS